MKDHSTQNTHFSPLSVSLVLYILCLLYAFLPFHPPFFISPLFISSLVLVDILKPDISLSNSFSLRFSLFSSSLFCRSMNESLSLSQSKEKREERGNGKREERGRAGNNIERAESAEQDRWKRKGKEIILARGENNKGDHKTVYQRKVGDGNGDRNRGTRGGNMDLTFLNVPLMAPFYLFIANIFPLQNCL